MSRLREDIALALGLGQEVRKAAVFAALKEQGLGEVWVEAQAET